jgi:hypothetical protein
VKSIVSVKFIKMNPLNKLKVSVADFSKEVFAPHQKG